MQKMKSSGKGSLLRSIFRAFGMDARAQEPALPLPSRVETQLSPSLRYSNYINAVREAELAKTQAIMELQRKGIL